MVESSAPRPALRHGPRWIWLVLLALVSGGVALTSAPIRYVAAAGPAGSAYVPTDKPERLADTREGTGFEWITPNLIKVQVAGRSGVARTATAAVLNVAALQSAGPTFVTVYPSGTAMPTAANVNLMPGQVVANMVTVQLGSDGAVLVYTLSTASLVVDVSGAYEPRPNGSAEGRFVPRADGAKRIFDSRDSNDYGVPGRVWEIGVPVDVVPLTASAVVVNLTATQASLGYYAAFPGSETSVPGTSTVNLDGDGQTRGAQAIIKMGSRRSIKVFTPYGGHVVIDVAGYYTGAGDGVSKDGLFVPRPPVRLKDTRNDRAMPLWGGSTVEFSALVPPGMFASAVVVNLAITQTLTAGFVTAYPAGMAKPLAANVNASSWDVTIANHAMVAISNRGLALFTSHGAHMIADLAGWFLAASPPPTGSLYPTSPSHSANAVTEVHTPSIGVSLFVAAGQPWELDWIADNGMAAAYQGHNLVGTAGNVMLFGHRTSHSAPLYYIDRVPYGAIITLKGEDGYYYDYVVVSKNITPADAQYIDSIGRNIGGAMGMTVQLIACHPLHSTRQRYVVTARFIGVRP